MAAEILDAKRDVFEPVMEMRPARSAPPESSGTGEPGVSERC